MTLEMEGVVDGGMTTGNNHKASNSQHRLSDQVSANTAVAPALHQHVEHLAFVIDGTPQIHPPAGDPHHHLVEVPVIARPWTPTA